MNYMGESRREYGLCASVPLWLGQSMAVHHRGTETQRTSDSSSPILNSEEPRFMAARGQLTSLKNIEKYAGYYRYKKRKMVRRSLDLHSWHDQGSVACSAELAGSTLAEASADICPVEYHAGVGESYLDQWVHSEGIHAA